MQMITYRLRLITYIRNANDCIPPLADEIFFRNFKRKNRETPKLEKIFGRRCFLLKKVAVTFGGMACEREVSIITGTFACNVLRGGAFDVLPVYFDENSVAYTSKDFFDIANFRKDDFLKKAKKVAFYDGALVEIDSKGKRLKRLATVDCLLNCCHGGLGEGGGVSALAEMQGIPLASPSIAPSALCMDKSLAKVFAKGLGIPVVDGMRVRERDYQKRGAFLLKNIERKKGRFPKKRRFSKKKKDQFKKKKRGIFFYS